MCGFLTEFIFEEGALTSRDEFESLLSLSKSRGPDSTEIERGLRYQLGFNRLSILDLSYHGNQPKFSPSKRYHVVFNGEIYNFKSLEKTYGLKNLQSTSDTEVLVHLLDCLGVEKTLKQLEGMFAISIVDTHIRTLYMARDFAGIKPLYYGIAPQGIVSASQFNQIFHHEWFKESLQLRPEIMKEYFALGYMSAPNTIFNGIYQLKPGELIEINSLGKISKSNFIKFTWDNSLNVDNEQFEAQVGKCLTGAVKEQLISDVPLATFLSGGIDSPLITAIAKQWQGHIEAFTIGVEKKHMDESEMAIRYAKQIGVAHHIETFTSKELLDEIDTHFDAFTEPFGDYSSLPTYLITKKARKNYKVMLSGDGGDELFFGYPRMMDIMKKKHWFRIPFKLRKLLIRLTNKLKLTHTWAPYHHETLSSWVLSKQSYINDIWIKAIFPNTIYSKELQQLYKIPKGIGKKSFLNWLRWNEYYGHLQRILIKVDRMSMGNSLEVRVPFLDRSVIIEALKFTPKAYKAPKHLKSVLKKLMLMYYDKENRFNQKRGFTVPIDQWLKNELKEDVNYMVFKKPIFGGDYMQDNKLKEYVKDFYSGKHGSAWGVWHIYAWQKWASKEMLI